VLATVIIDMDFNYKTKAYLQEMQAVLIDSKYKIFQIDFENMKALVNKQDTYKKRNGKTCHVEHKFGRWIPFKKEDISWGMRNYTSYDSSVHGLEEIKGQKATKYLKPEIKEQLVAEYMQSL
jgi:hypothetical protein